MNDQINGEILVPDGGTDTASRIRQLVVTVILCGMGLAAAFGKVLGWPLVVLLVVGILAYTSKSVLLKAVERIPLPAAVQKLMP